MRSINSEVLVVGGDVVRVRAADLVAVQERAALSSRKRARLCAHADPVDPLHEMLICLARDTYVRPHRHVGKTESFHVIEGELDVLLFHPHGTVREIIRMGSYASGKVFFYRLMAPCYHTVLVRTPQALFHETTNGPFEPTDTEFAAWAPPEGDPGVAAYVDSIRLASISE
jgi:cupin fold WbuC family metalloprotein